MTPDYAKRVFQSKSSSVKTYYFKLFGSIAATLLLIILVFGMFNLQEEANQVDKNLLRYKRDPMPGPIKPKQAQATELFATAPVETDQETLEMMASMQSDMRSGDENVESDGSIDSPQTVRSGDVSSSVEQKSFDSDSISSDEESGIDAVAATGGRADARQPSVSTTNSMESPSAKDSGRREVKVSVSHRVSDKDQLLQSAYTAYEAGRMDQARADYGKVLNIDPENRDALLGRAAIHVLDNEYSQAIEIYQQVLLANPKDSVAMASLMSVANIEPQAGETQIKQMLREQPRSPYLHFALGNMYGNQQRWSDAQSSYFKALESKPNDPNYAYNLAVSLEHLNKPAAAVGFYQKALSNMSYGLATFDQALVSQRIEVLTQ